MNAPRLTCGAIPGYPCRTPRARCTPGLGDALRKAHTGGQSSSRPRWPSSDPSPAGGHPAGCLRPTERRRSRRPVVGGCVPEEPLAAFAAQYSARFDLFSPTAPSCNPPISADTDAGRSRQDGCSTCTPIGPPPPRSPTIGMEGHGGRAMPGLRRRRLRRPARLATSGGAGIRPSINGVPPIYGYRKGKPFTASSPR